MRWPWQHKKKKRNIAQKPQELQGIQLSSSAVGLAIPLVYGQARVPSKLIHYKKLTLSSGDAAIYGKTTGDPDPEHAAIAMAICEGPITGIVQAWDDKDNANAATLTALGFLTFLGTLSQAAWSFLTTNYPGEAVPYELTAYMAHPKWPLPNNALANYSWEVQALLQWGSGIVDANPKDVINDFLTDTNHGLGMSSSLIASLTTFRDYCTAAGIFLSPVFDTQRPASEILQELLACSNSEIVWSDGQIKIVPYGDQNLSGNSATFTANTTPIYNLTDDDFIAGEGEDPVHCTRRAQSDVYNMVQVEFDNRSNQYNGDVAEAKDQNSIELYQLKPAEVIKAPFVKLATVARLLAQLAVQRQVYIRNDYAFTLPMRYALVEPMDFVSLTDSILGLNQTLVRIKEIDENDDETFSVVAEEWTVGVGTAPNYGSTSTGGAPTPTGWEKSPAMPGVFASFDATGQLILNLSGDSRTVRHIYNVRTDRLPTIPETRAGTAVAFAGQANIATGIFLLPGRTAYIGDLAYNSIGGESAQSTAAVKREGTDVDGSGRTKRANPFDDGKWATKASDSGGGQIDGSVAAPSASQAGAWSSSGVTLATTAATINDGDLESNSFHTDTALPGAYVQVDMGAPTSFDHLRLFVASAGTLALWKVRHSPDGSTWTDAVTNFAPIYAGWNVAAFAAIARRYWRLELMNTPGAGAWNNEVELAYSQSSLIIHNRPHPAGRYEDMALRTDKAIAGGGNVKRGRPLDDGSYSLRATEADGSTKSSSAHNSQGSFLPATSTDKPFSYAAGGSGGGAMWVAWTWSAFTIWNPDGTTRSVGASSALTTPPSPTLSQVAGGALGARTLFARIGYTKNGLIFRIGAEASLAVSAGNLLKVTSPASVAGYDGWFVCVGSATNAEKAQSFQAFGTDWTEPSTGFDATGTPYSNSSWPNAVIDIDQTVSSTYYYYPYWDIPLGQVVFPSVGLSAPDPATAALQNADQHITLTKSTGMPAATPGSGGSNSGTPTQGGGRFT